jgi:hypothetical protein
MLHALLYHGPFDLNFARLVSGTSVLTTSEGASVGIPPRPLQADGIAIGFMDRRAGRFFAVRLQYGDDDVVLRSPIGIDAIRHLGGRRLTPTPIVITDDLASSLLDDVIAANPAQAMEIGVLISRVNQTRRARREAHEQPAQQLSA